MKFTTAAVAIFCLAAETVSAFSTSGASSRAFVVSRSTAATTTTSVQPRSCIRSIGCNCDACTGRRGITALFSTEAPADEEAPAAAAADAEVPAEVEAMDGVEDDEEAHNVDRPARQQLKKKRAPRGKPLTDFEVGTTVTGKVKSVASYGAFVDIGASTDGLLHISQLASGYVASVGDIVQEGQELEVRIINLDAEKKQIGLSLMTEEEAEQQSQGRPQRQQQSNRRDDSAAVASLMEKGWDQTTFVEGTVVSTVDFGCFVRIDASKLNSECEGELGGLVHISTLAVERVRAVTDVANVDDKIQVRLKGIDGRKVSLTALSLEDEAAKAEAQNDRSSGGDSAPVGAADWAEQLEKFKTEMPTFVNGPMIVDTRK